jgi:hypothetical protein
MRQGERWWFDCSLCCPAVPEGTNEICRMYISFWLRFSVCRFIGTVRGSEFRGHVEGDGEPLALGKECGVLRGVTDACRLDLYSECHGAVSELFR